MFLYTRPKLEDILAIQNLLDKTWRVTYTYRLETELEKIALVFHSTKALKTQINNPEDFLCIVKNEAENIVGIISGRQSKGIIHIGRLYVDPNYHFQYGIGTELLKRIENNFPSTKHVLVEVDAENEVGYSWYLKKGFKKTGTKIDNTTIEGIVFNLIVMEKGI